MDAKAVELTKGKGNLPMLKLRAPRSEAEIYLHGAHLTHFKKKGEPPLLFVSHKSWFEANKPIRGGVPICFPWFGGREGGPSHGLARILTWELLGTSVEANGSVKARLLLPQKSLPPEWSALRTEFMVTVGETLTMELITKNESPDRHLVAASARATLTL